MAMKTDTTYRCTICNYARSTPWEGKCPACQDGQGKSYSMRPPIPDRIELADHHMFGSGN